MVGYPVIGLPIAEMASIVLPCIGDTMSDMGIYGGGEVHYGHYLTSDGKHYVTSDGMYYKVKD